MKIIAIFFALTAFTVLKAMILQEVVGQDVVQFPEFDVPETEFVDLSGGCSGFIDCNEYIGNVLKNIGTGVIALVLFLIELVQFAYGLISLLISVSFAGIDGAPTVVNVLLSLPFIIGIGVILYKMLRSGDTDT